jgi:hypothetical protein
MTWTITTSPTTEAAAAISTSACGARSPIGIFAEPSNSTSNLLRSLRTKDGELDCVENTGKGFGPKRRKSRTLDPVHGRVVALPRASNIKGEVTVPTAGGSRPRLRPGLECGPLQLEWPSRRALGMNVGLYAGLTPARTRS